MAEHHMKKENYSSAIKLLEDLLKTPQPSMVQNTFLVCTVLVSRCTVTDFIAENLI